MIRGPVLATIATAVVSAAALGLGRPFDRLHPASLTDPERWAFRLLCGAGALGLVLFVVGHLIFTPLAIGLIVGGAAVLNLVVHGRPGSPQDAAIPLADRRSAVLLVAAFVLLVLGFAALARPVGSFGHDGVSYHLLGPTNWLRAQKIGPVLDHSHTAFPATIETLFAAVMALSNDRAPGLLGVVFAGILLIQTWGLAKRLGSSDFAASLSTALVATMPVVMFSADIGFIDVPFAAFSLATARLAFDASSRRELVLAGVFGGFAMGTKYTGIPMLFVTVLVLLFFSIRARGKYIAARNAFILVGVASAVGGAWYLKNLLVLGAPIYPPPPALARLLPVRAFPLEASMAFQNYILDRGQGFGRGLLDFVLLPVRFTYQAHRFHGAGGIGIAPLAMGPIGILAARHDPLARRWIAWAFALTAVWFVTQQEARFLVHVLVVVSVFAGLGAAALLQREQTGLASKVVVWVALCLSFAYGSAFLVRERVDRIMAVVSARHAEERRRDGVPFASAFAFLNRAPDVAAVLIFHPFVPPFYLDRPYVKIRGQYGERPVEGVETVQDAMEQLKALGVSHILDVRYWGVGFEVPSSHPCVNLVYSTADARIYRVNHACEGLN